jgi:hypothetical protein
MLEALAEDHDARKQLAATIQRRLDFILSYGSTTILKRLVGTLELIERRMDQGRRGRGRI